MTEADLHPRFQLEHGRTARVGADRIRLLQAIAAARSITAGAKAVGMSYRGAWDAVQALNTLFGRPMVEAQVGGREGGQAAVTPAGQALILAFTRIDAELAHVVGQLEAHLAEDEPLDRLSWRLGMKTSARNTLSGVVAQVDPGAVNSEVVLHVGAGASTESGVPIVAIITKESAEELALAPGRPAVALVKSSFVILAPGHEPIRTSARNRLPGTVVEHREGVVNDEVVLDCGHGLRVTATVTRESGEELGLGVGAKAQALIKASHVIVAVD
ncbi:MAG: TOBE domain-containing protein [Caulobacteraceae bacterium]|nr:TOBE domain-containing protein [Caulobacter sp.]